MVARATLSVVLVLATAGVVSTRPPVQDPQQKAAGGDPDALYRERESPDRARQAAELWAQRADVDADAAWKLARVCQWLGTHGPAADRRTALERGVRAGERAVALAPDRPEGHFWLAANMGTLAESFGLRQGLKYRGRIRDELERVIALDPDWQEGSAEAALGRWYDEVPGLFGGSDRKAEEHLRRALAINPQSRRALTYLAEMLIDHRRNEEARQLLERAIEAPIDPEWAPEDRELRAEAAARLSALEH
jgi:tetratricopeptide (TPR) repeat protein